MLVTSGVGEGDLGAILLLPLVEGSRAEGSSVEGSGCLRFRDLSFARRSFRSFAAASREAWVVDMVRLVDYLPQHCKN